MLGIHDEGVLLLRVQLQHYARQVTLGRSLPLRTESSERFVAQAAEKMHRVEPLAAFDYITAGFAVDPTHSPKLKMGMLVSAVGLGLIAGVLSGDRTPRQLDTD
jgi:hypothetical protein